MATWWLGEPAAFDDAWQRPERLIIKPLERSPSERPIVRRGPVRRPSASRCCARIADAAAALRRAGVGARLAGAGARGRGARRARSRRAPSACACSRWRRPSGWRVMPGGLTRVAGDEDSRVIAMQRGGRSKDTWVLSDGPVNASFSLLSHDRDRRRTWSTRTRPCRRAPPRTCSGSAATASAATARCGCCASRSATCSTTRAGAAAASPPAWALARQLGLIDTTATNVPRQLRRAATQSRGGAQRSGCASSRASPSACATGCRPTTGAPSTASSPTRCSAASRRCRTRWSGSTARSPR